MNNNNYYRLAYILINKLNILALFGSEYLYQKFYYSFKPRISVNDKH